MMDSLSRWQGLKFWIGYILGDHLKFPESRLYKTESAIIETEPRKYVIIGGEKTVRTPVQVKIDPAAVKIMAPASFHDHDERREEETPAPATEEKESGDELTGTSSEPGKEIPVFRPGELSSLARIQAEEYGEPDKTLESTHGNP